MLPSLDNLHFPIDYKAIYKMMKYQGHREKIKITDFFFLPQCGPNTPLYNIHIPYKYKYTSECNIPLLNKDHNKDHTVTLQDGKHRIKAYYTTQG